uniref:AMP-binding protein n=1 Tax=Alistipes sp. TaxID=1872444 RepID=UPI0040561F91
MQENLIKIYEQSFRENREMSALTDYFKKETFSYYEMAKEVAKLHLLYKKAGIKRGDKISLVGRNNPRWCITYIATITYGAVIVPILQDFTSNDIIHIINHSESKLLFLGDNYWDGIEEDQIPEVDAVFSLTDFSVVYERNGKSLTEFQKNITKNYRAKYPRGFSVNDIKYPEVPNDAVCLLNYTSGTTGYSKGVMLTVNNLTGNVVFAQNAHNTKTGLRYFEPGNRTLSFLPLAHAYGCTFDFLAPLALGQHITLLGRIPTPKILLEAMKEVSPSVVCCVPMILEKVYRKQVLPMLEKGPMSIATKIPLLSNVLYSVIRKKLIDAFGGNVGIFIVGGAPMNQETESFLRKINFPLTVGYGMTECAPLVSFSPDNEFKQASCGSYKSIVSPANGNHLEVKIDSPDPEKVAGEILIKGEHVMLGYYKNEKDTKAVLPGDGWLHTGDMGTMDPDGTIYIRGRLKTMILTGNGQNIYPEEIEDRLNNMYLVLESLIIEANGRLHALVVPDYEQVEKEGVDKQELPKIMEQNLEELNKMLAAYERVSSIRLYPTEFEKTPKRSIKRYLYNAVLLDQLK